MFPWEVLRVAAELVKAHDACHSTLMEGYRISRQASDGVVAGQPLPEDTHEFDTLQAARAIQGYSNAFAEVLRCASRQAPVDTGLILDLCESLFRSSMDAEVTDSAALRAWRTSSVGLRPWRYVPPNAKKIPDLIGGLERLAARADLAPVAREVLVHLEFVTIHPFSDGNGRVGRLLMNHALLSAGLPWVTIQSGERVAFFKALEEAQVDEEPSAVVRFLWQLIRESVQQLQHTQTWSSPAQRKNAPGRR